VSSSWPLLPRTLQFVASLCRSSFLGRCALILRLISDGFFSVPFFPLFFTAFGLGFSWPCPLLLCFIGWLERSLGRSSEFVQRRHSCIVSVSSENSFNCVILEWWPPLLCSSAVASLSATSCSTTWFYTALFHLQKSKTPVSTKFSVLVISELQVAVEGHIDA